MFDDPRWGDDPRDRDDDPRERDRIDRDAEWDQPGHRNDLGDRHSDRDNDSRQLGRGPSSDNRDPYDGSRSRDRSDERSRDRDERTRGRNPRDVFMRDLHLPGGQEREVVHDARGREYTLRGSESRTISTAGAFRVVPSRELRDHDGRRADSRRGDLRHLREQGLVETVRVPGQRDVAVTATDHGPELLETRRRDGHDPRQEYYAGVKRERELEHDVQIYDAYLRTADRLDAAK